MENPVFVSFSDRFASWASEPHLQLTDHNYAEARISLLDTLACMVTGAQEQQSHVAMDALQFGQEAGPIEAVGGGAGLSLMSAAMMNGVRAHAIDFDDHEQPGGSHVSAPIYSALFALARVQPMTIDQICNAWVVGYEAVIWLATALGYHHYDKGWHSTSTLGPIGTAAAISRALGSSANQISSAMAIAASSSAGLKAQFGTDTKALHVGFAAESGLRAALLARAGASTNTALWHGKYGFGSLFDADSARGFDRALKEMKPGQALKVHPVCRKLWPSCGYTHRAIAAVEKLHQRVGDVHKVLSIHVRMPEPFHRVAGFSKPTTEAEARFSTGYCVVTGLLSGHVSPDDFRQDLYSDPVRRGLIEQIEWDLYNLPQGDAAEIGPSTPETVKVILANGTVHEETVEYLPGGAENPITQAQLLRKLSDCGCSVELAGDFLRAEGETTLSEMHFFDRIADA